MKDVRFIIVNSKLPHAQILRHELENRVSFDVYQDTEEKDVWKLMEGGKDDIYVYDRCGRLAYYIPFPLSIMSGDNSLLPSAILATYFLSPCGETCDKTERSSLEDYLNNNSHIIETTTEELSVTQEIYQNELMSNRSEIVNAANETALPENERQPRILINESDSYSSEDFDYSFFNDSSDYDEDNNTTHTNQTYEIEQIYDSTITINDTEESNYTFSTNHSHSDVHPKNISNENPLAVSDHHGGIEVKKPEVDHIPKTKLHRCAEADLFVCNNWSKRKLLRAQNCCSTQLQNSERCRNFGKKRCKKIRTVLKCCIKTAYVETTTTEEPVMHFDTTEVNEATTDIKFDIVCCKNTHSGRLCRVATTPTCEDDEFIAENDDGEQSTAPEDSD